MTQEEPLMLPCGRQADTPLEFASLYLQRSLKTTDVGTIHELVQRALNIVDGLDTYTAYASSPASEHVQNQVTRTMEHDWKKAHDEGLTKLKQTVNCCAGNFEATFVASMVRAARATSVLEIGMFTGTTTLAVAEALPEDGRIVALDVEPYLRTFASKGFNAAGVQHKVDVMIGPGLDSLKTLKHDGATFDVIFIDADKTGYANYYKYILDNGLLAPNGILLVDNTLFKGMYFDNKPVNGNESAEALRVFNEMVRNDPRVSVAVLPLRDGVSLISRVPSTTRSKDDVYTGLGGLDVLQRFKLNRKVAVVTGAGQGIGRAFAHALGEAGAAVAIVDINEDHAKQVSEELVSKGVRSIYFKANVTIKEDCTRMVQRIVETWGRLDIAVNNAGVNFNSAAEDITDNEWDSTFAVNTKGVLYCCQAEADYMLKTKSHCSIINTASMATLLVPHPQKQAAYNASKAAVVKLTQSMAVEWADRNVRVNAISPGIVNTALIRGNKDLQPLVDTWLGQIPLARLAEVTDLQAAIVWMASDASLYMTGQNIAIEGGQSVV